MNRELSFEPLAIACAKAQLSYMVGWRLVTSGKVVSKRNARGQWYVRPADLRPFAELVTVGVGKD